MTGPPTEGRDQSTARAGAVPAAGAGGTESIRVLHVDDDTDLSDLVASFLEREHDALEVITEASASAGEERLAEEPVDCVVSDYEMPGMDGLEFLEAVRERHPDLPFILYTGKGSEEIAGQAISAGVTDYLQKESGTEQYAVLANRVVNAVEKRRTERQLRRREESLRRAQRIARLGNWDWNVRTGALRWSAEIYDIFGVDHGEFEGTYDAFLEFVHPEDRDRLEDAVQGALESGETYEIQHRVVRPDGEVRTVHERGEVRFEDGEPVSMTGTVQDITELAAARERTRVRERSIEALHDATAAFAACRTETEVAELAVEVAADVLSFDRCVVDLAEGDTLRVAATSTDLPAEDTASMSTDEGLAGQTYRSGETTLVEDVEDHPVAEPQGPYRSALSVPIGGYGIFQAAATGVGAFDEDDRRLAELMLAHAETALERVERERHLRAFREAVECAGHSIYWTDADGTIQYVNPTFEEVTGYAAAEAIGENPRILQSGEHDEDYYADLWETITAGERWTSEVVNRRKDGERYVVDQTISPVTDDAGEVERYVAVNNDVTERRESERALRASRRKYRTLIDTAPDPIVVADAESGTIREANAAAERLFGRSSEELVGAPQTVLHPSEKAAEYRALFERHAGVDTTVLSELVDDSQIEVVDADGRRIPVEINATVVDLDGERLVQGIFRDLSDRRERERELRRQNERLERFASVVSHDLRNPLQAASGRLDLAREDCDSDHLPRVEAALGRMEDLIESTLALARQGQTVSEPEPVDLAAAVEDAWGMVETDGAALEADDLGRILADGERLRQLLENLFRNGVEHAANGDLTLRVGPLADGFYVEDTGPGIPPDAREKVFESGYTGTEGGVGFGLAIVQEIAEAHGWRVAVTEGADGGARFEVTGVDAA